MEQDDWRKEPDRMDTTFMRVDREERQIIRNRRDYINKKIESDFEMGLKVRENSHKIVLRQLKWKNLLVYGSVCLTFFFVFVLLTAVVLCCVAFFLSSEALNTYIHERLDFLVAVCAIGTIAGIIPLFTWYNYDWEETYNSTPDLIDNDYLFSPYSYRFRYKYRYLEKPKALSPRVRKNTKHKGDTRHH